MKIIVLGGGLVGGPMAIDLSMDKDKEVAVADVNPNVLQKFNKIANLNTIQADLGDEQKLRKLIEPFDIVLSAVPGFMGFKTLQTIIECGKNVIDIAFFPEDLFELDKLAKDKGVIAISDIGVAPGMSNVLIGYAAGKLDTVDKAITYVGGLPKIRQWPYEYKAVFSPVDVIEEYTRPARYIKDGKEVVMPALSEPELMEFDGIGTLEAFNSDGLRTLAKTIKGSYMIEKTLRYPGHIELMRVLRETGFFSTDSIEINGLQIRPLDFTAKLLFPKWKLNEGEEDITVMKVIIEGKSGISVKRFEYDLFDRYDVQTGVHSMARTTGYTATMALRMVANGLYTQKGVSAPEFIGKNEACVKFMLNGLKERGVIYHEKISH
ncbi:MAG TPA: saccharopine dehydrogenase C-terminal domain-containing protein [Bacteroidales bacterium]|nr:saccharopine dehydrogenase C-terminal domain-containing protein [Bacteroidales bacterium]HRX96093.1 saccharopine dehydrogenase C-terminal domain-containing protein [Bacteroidales bacterium]